MYLLSGFTPLGRVTSYQTTQPVFNEISFGDKPVTRSVYDRVETRLTIEIADGQVIPEHGRCWIANTETGSAWPVDVYRQWYSVRTDGSSATYSVVIPSGVDTKKEALVLASARSYARKLLGQELRELWETHGRS